MMSNDHKSWGNDKSTMKVPLAPEAKVQGMTVAAVMVVVRVRSSFDLVNLSHSPS